MARRRRNPFYVLLGIVGVVFTLTAVSSCLTVLRGVRPETAAGRGTHPLDRLLDRHGTALLAAELVVLAIATVGAVAVDHADGERERAARAAARGRAEAAPPAGEP
jgi:hypothetical protein